MTTSSFPLASDKARSARPFSKLQTFSDDTETAVVGISTVGRIALNLLRLVLGFEFLWAFLDKTFGLGYTTPAAKSWLNGGSPTKGYLSSISAGPLKGIYNNIAGMPVVDWIFMLGLLGIGLALILGIGVRIATIAGVVMLLAMWVASWPFASVVDGQPTGSTNPVIDDHIISALALLIVGIFAVQSAGYLGRWWSNQSVVRRVPLLR